MVGGPRSDPNARNVLNSFIKKLDDTLKESQFLTGDKLTSADIACWSLLAPDGTLKDAQNIENLTRWYKAIATLPEVVEATNVLPIKKLHFASIVQSNRFGGFHHIHLIPHVGDEELHLLSENQGSVADTILPEELTLAKESFVKEIITERVEPKIV